MTLAENLRQRREEYELSQQELADRTGTTRGLIARIENGLAVPSLPVAVSIADALNTSVDWLVGRKVS